MTPGRTTIWLLIIAVSALSACFDISALTEGWEPYGQSPLFEPDAAWEGADGTAPTVDVLLPDLDIDFAGLEDFSLAAVDPPVGSIDGKEVVMLVGAGFHDYMEVYFGEAKASDPFVVTPNYATVETPPHWPGMVDVRLVGKAGEVAVLPGGFTFVAPLLVEAVEPAEGPDVGGTPVLISGSGFDAGCEVLLGGRKATFVALADPFTLQAVTPAGNCGGADVTVLCGGEKAVLPEGFHYQGQPRIDALWPAVGPPEGGILVEIQGRSFTPEMSVAVNDAVVPWYDLQFLAPTHVRFNLPPGEPGPAVLSLATVCGQTVVEDRFLYGAIEGDPSPATLLGAVPLTVPACAGGFVTLALTDIGDPEWLQVLGGGSTLNIVAYDEDLGTVDVLVPAGPAGAVPIQVLTDAGTAAGSVLVVREKRPFLQSVSPASGYVGGGTEVVLKGCDLPPEPEVRFGANIAADVMPLSVTQIGAVTPPGSPGPVDVSVAGGGELAVLPAGFSYQADSPSLFLLDPDFGPVSGGTYVRLHGAGFPPNATVAFGEKPGFALHYVDSSLITVRAPANEVGTYDVRVDWPAGSVSLAQAWTSFNPMSKKGGTWGGAIDESVNVTVLDSGTGKGLAAAFVFLGEEVETPHQGFTDEHGQISFSMPGLKGPVAVTAAKQGYNLYSVVHYDAANVTVYLTPMVSGSSGGTSTPSQSFVAGRVHGLDKYVVVPPGNCSKKVVEGPLCDACESDVDCGVDELGEPLARCLDIGDTGRYCVTPCLAPEECPEKFICAKAAFDYTGCLPKGGDKSIRCESSKGSMFGSPPNPGPGGVTNAHDIYFIESSTGDVAVVCYGGYTDADTYQFVPTVMGIRRNIIVLKNVVVKDQDITLNIPLTGEGRIAFHDLPHHPEGIRKPYLLLSLELGKEGFLNPPVKPEWIEEGGYYRVAPLPAQMTGPLTGTTFSMYASVQSDTLYSMPYAVRMVSEIESLSGDGLIRFQDGAGVALHPPILGDVIGLSYRGEEDLYVATDRGELLHFDGHHWTPAGIPGAGEGFVSMAEDAAGGIWIGGRKGTVWHFNGVAWKAVKTGISAPVRDLWAAAGKAVAVFSNLLVTVNDFGIEETVAAPGGHQLTGVWGADFEDLYVLSEPPVVWNRTPGAWKPVAQYGGVTFTDVDGSGPDDFWVTASPGTLLHFDGDGGYQVVELDPYAALNAVHVPAPGRVYAGATDGRLYVRQPDGSFALWTTESLQDFLVVDSLPGTDRVMAAGVQAYNLGPFMAFPRVIQPAADQLFDFSSLQWDYWTEGAKADFHYVILSTQDGFPFWLLVVDGETTEVALPPLTKALGLNLFPDGKKRMNLTSSLNPEFNIDYYSSSDFSIYRKVSWAVELVNFK